MDYESYETKRQLIKELDKCLLDHAVAAGTQKGGPEILDVYRLQGLSEIHYYLKAEHDFKPGEAAALLQFADPLLVAAECWEERSPEKGFPICDLLDKIEAYERFTLADAGLIKALEDLLDKNMSDFHASLLDMDKETIISKSAEITAMREARAFMQSDFTFEPGDIKILLSMENPLQFVAEQWPSDIAEMFDMNDLLGEVLDTVKQTQGLYRQDPVAPEETKGSVQAGKPSVLGQLRDAARETGQRPTMEGKARGGEAR